MVRGISLLLLSCFIVRCSNGHHKAYLRPAPSQTEDLGHIVTATPVELEALVKAYPNVQIRTLNHSRNLYEVSHASLDQLQQHLSAKDLTANTFIKDQQFGATDFLKSETPTDQNNPALELLGVLKTCVRSKTQPSLMVSLSAQQQTPTIRLGDSISAMAHAASHLKVGGSVRLTWGLLIPTISGLQIKENSVPQIKITPDTVGLYRVGVVAQSEDMSCSFQDLAFMVTDNPELQTSTTAFLGATPQFKHLQEIKADKAWSLARGDGVVVAVLDTGINYNHPSLQNSVYFNVNELNDNKDNDGNGLLDDSMGWDFINADRFPFDDEGHGSHVSGLIASAQAGVAPLAKILPVKILDASGRSDLGSLIAGIYYALDSGAKIINTSLAFTTPAGASPFDMAVQKPPQLVKALEEARAKNVLFVTAAGNGDDRTGVGFDIQSRPVYPASLESSNRLTVAATSLGVLTSYSNFDDKLVQIAAPGGDEKEMIFSTATENNLGIGYIPLMGTSMATPIVTGVAALMFSENRDITPEQVIQILLATGDDTPSLHGKVASGKIVNAEQALLATRDWKATTPDLHLGPQ